MSKVENFRQRKRDWGLKRALHWELMHALSLLGVRVHYVNVGADMKVIDGETAPTVPPGYETRVASFDELLPFSDRVPGLTRAFLNEASARGDRCLANFFHGELVGFSFSCYTRAPVTAQLDVVIPPGFRYGYKGWTHPDHRRAKLSKMRGYVRRRDTPFLLEERSISYIETHNYASALHSYRHPRERNLRMGFSGWITLFRRQIPFNTRRAKWIGFEFVRREDDGKRQYV